MTKDNMKTESKDLAQKPPFCKTDVSGSNSFKKILKCKDGGTWYLTDEELKKWEQDGSIKSGDILYRVVTDTLY